MCGIFGTTARISSTQFLGCLDILHHRGPDERVHYQIRDIHFGMQRLAIQDLTPQLYPFLYKNKALIFNGELYNVPLIQKLLTQKTPYRCRTSCDAEVILPLIHHFGWRSLSYLQGMFSIAIYDEQMHTLTLARDMFGEKPLYYFHAPHTGDFWFSSELKAFPRSLRTIDPSALGDYLDFGFIPETATTYTHIKKVAPGQVVQYNLQTNTVTCQPYATLQCLPSSGAACIPNVHSLDATIQALVRRKMIADVPVGCFLSGGVDSSLITALAQREATKPLHTYSVSFAGYDEDESHYARQVAIHLGTQHHEIRYTADNITRDWDAVLYHLDEPLCDPAVFPTFSLAAAAHKDVTVVLTGEGGDELFSGYERYQREQWLEIIRSALSTSRVPSQIFEMHYTLWRTLSPLRTHYTSVNYLTPWISSKHWRIYTQRIEELWATVSPNCPVTSSTVQAQLFDLHHYVAEQLCMKVDKMCMAHSIESRAPFLDTRLLPFMSASADEMKKQHITKPLLKKVAENYLPHKCIYRTKRGFSLPLSAWLKEPLAQKCSQLNQLHPYIKDLYGKNTGRDLLQLLESGKKCDLTVWNVMIVDAWLKANNY